MPTKLFVGNLNHAFSRDELGDLFSQFGKLTEYDLVRNYAFVHFEREEDAIQAMKELNNKVYQGTELHVELSKCQYKSGKWNPTSSRPQRMHDDRQGYIARQRERSSSRSAPYSTRDFSHGRYPDREYSRPPYRELPPPRIPSQPHREYIQYPKPRQIRGNSEFWEREKSYSRYDDYYEGFNRYEGYEGYTTKSSNSKYVYEDGDRYEDNTLAEQ